MSFKDDATSQSGDGAATPGTPTTESENPYQQIWDDALSQCHDTLGSGDFEAISDCESFKSLIGRLHELYATYSDKWVPRVLRPLESQLQTLRRLSHAIALAMRASYVRTGIIWGLVNLLIEASIQSERVLTIVVEMIEELTHFLDLLLIYQFSPLVAGDMEKALVEVFVDIVTFGAYTVKFLRRHPLENFALNAWPGNVASELSRVSERAQKRATRIKEKVLAKEIQHGISKTRAEMAREMYTVSRTHDLEAILPCKHLPLPSNDDFYGREDILSQLKGELDQVEIQQKQKAVAMWGTQGIGKSQIALSYAWAKQSEQLPAVFWINSESSMEIGQSFTKIACALKLAGAEPDGNDQQNWYLVIKWLERTSIRWLLIFDNVEDINIVLDRWPASANGSIVLTSRREIYSPGIISLEVPVFTEVQGAELLMKLVSPAPGQSKSSEELASAQELSRLLGGLPLGLTLVAMQIRRKRFSFSKFLPFYQKHWARIHELEADSLKPYYRQNLATAWELSFAQLAEDSSDGKSIFGILSLLSSENIPVDLFQPPNIEDLPDTMKFCADPWSFEEALETLFGSALVRKNPASETLFVHRLIQSAYRGRMSKEEIRQNFKSASKLLLEAFPKLGDKLTHRGHWMTCKKYMQQVISLTNRFEEYKLEVESPNEFSDFAQCISSCAWYLFEIGAWPQCQQLTKSGLKACDDKHSLIYANISNTAGIISGCNNRAVEAYEFFQRSLEIRQELLPKNHEQIANAFNNLANEAVAKREYDVALDLYRQAAEIDTANNSNRRFHFRHINTAIALMLQGNCREAHLEIEVGRKHVVGGHDSTVDNRAYDDIVAYTTGQIYYREGSYILARKWFERAWEQWLKETPLHPVTAAARFKMACADLRLGNVDEAIKSFREARLIAEFNEATQLDKGNIARILRRLAEALKLKDANEEADKLHIEAEKIRKELQGSSYSAKDDTEESYERLVAQYCYYYR